MTHLKLTPYNILPQAGNYCEQGTTAISALNLCPAGHYCPDGTQSANQHPCPEGTYLNNKGKSFNWLNG